MTDQTAPVWHGILARCLANRKVTAKIAPWFQRGGESPCGCGNVEQHRFASLAHRQPSQPGGIHARRTEQLSRRPNAVQTVGKLTEAEADTHFFVGDRRIVRRQFRIEIAQVMSGPALHRGFQQPFGQPIPSAALLRQLNRQTRHMGWLTQLVGERRSDGLIPQFHE